MNTATKNIEMSHGDNQMIIEFDFNQTHYRFDIFRNDIAERHVETDQCAYYSKLTDADYDHMIKQLTSRLGDAFTQLYHSFNTM